MKDKLVYLIVSLVGIAVIGLVVGLIISLNHPKEFTVKVIDPVSSANPPSMIVKEGSKIKDLKVPIKDGYVFKYWSLDGEPLDPETEITQDLSLIPVYESKDVINATQQWVVTFENCDLDSVKVMNGGLLTKPQNPVKDGYVFVEWQKDGKKYDFATAVTSDITLTAVWEREKTTTNTNTNTHTNTNTNTNVNTNTNTNNNGSNVYKLTFKFNELDAKVEINGQQYGNNQTITINFDNDNPGNGIDVKIKPLKYDLDGMPTSSGAEFHSNGMNSFFITKINQSKATININVKQTTRTQTVTFNPNNGSPIISVEVPIGTKVQKPATPTNGSECTFLGWKRYGQLFDFNTEIYEPVSVYADWSCAGILG